MDLPKEIIVLKESLKKAAKRKGRELWEKTKVLKKTQQTKEQIRCANCGLKGHTHEVHEKQSSRYETVGGRVGCKEEFLAYPNAQQKIARAVIAVPKYRHWHKQTFRGKNK